MKMRDQNVFSPVLRLLHVLMAIAIFSMLFIGIWMVSSLADYSVLVSIHRPLGILILMLAAIRLVIRWVTGIPKLPEAMPAWQKYVAHASHWLLYGLMFALPIVGWAMLSAAAYPIVLYGPIELPPILPHNIAVYADLRTLHSALAFSLFSLILAHAGAGMLHALIFRDGVFQSMWTIGRSSAGKETAK